jgi:hypothetical protein
MCLLALLRLLSYLRVRKDFFYQGGLKRTSSIDASDDLHLFTNRTSCGKQNIGLPRAGGGAARLFVGVKGIVFAHVPRASNTPRKRHTLDVTELDRDEFALMRLSASARHALSGSGTKCTEYLESDDANIICIAPGDLVRSTNEAVRPLPSQLVDIILA